MDHPVSHGRTSASTLSAMSMDDQQLFRADRYRQSDDVIDDDEHQRYHYQQQEHDQGVELWHYRQRWRQDTTTTFVPSPQCLAAAGDCSGRYHSGQEKSFGDLHTGEQQQLISDQMPQLIDIPVEGNDNCQHHRDEHNTDDCYRQLVPPELQGAFNDLDAEIQEVFYGLNPEQQKQALDMLAEQQRQQQQQQNQIQQQEEMITSTIPMEHFLTISLDGIILGATEMVTGFPPNSLLWTSIYDLVHDDDLLGLRTIKLYYWERDQPDVEAYIRRRTIEGEWIWLVATIVSYTDSPVPGMIIRETIVQNINIAISVHRMTRIASLLLRAVEASRNDVDFAVAGTTITGEDPASSAFSVSDCSRAADIRVLLSEAAKLIGVDVMSDNENPLRELIQAATPSTQNRLNDKYSSQRSNHPKDLLDCLQSGASLDLSKIVLSEGELKLVMLVITGRLQVEDLKPLIYLTLNSPGMDLVAVVDEYFHLSEKFRSNTNTQCASGIFPSILTPPPIVLVNFSHTEIGDEGMVILSESLHACNASLVSLDVSFCNISSQGLLSLCHGLRARSARGLPLLQALSLTGNTIHFDIAKQLGRVLSAEWHKTGEEGSERLNNASPLRSDGIRVLHLGCTSISVRSLIEILTGLGPYCPLEELKINSNMLGTKGAASLVAFLNAKSPKHANLPFLPKLHRIDVSFNNLGDLGTTNLIRAISKRAKIDVTAALLSGNEIGSSCIEKIMNIFLLHKLMILNLDNNAIGDQGCQLVAASLPSIPSLKRLNLAFNNIGVRGMATLMRSLIGCESITSLGLSGIAMKISGAIAMGYTLAQHPRLSTLELHNCCLSQVAQCHIVAGIISNRWVPMKVIHGFRVGPPMVAIGALNLDAQYMTNEECFRLRRDIQMKTMLQWIESNRKNSIDVANPNLYPDAMNSAANDTSGAPSQSTYLRMLDWLGRIPFDESELMDLQRYFYDTTYSEGERQSRNNLRHRGDILAALASDIVEEILESEPVIHSYFSSSVGLDLSRLDDEIPHVKDDPAWFCFDRTHPPKKKDNDCIHRVSAEIEITSSGKNEGSNLSSINTSVVLDSVLSEATPNNFSAPKNSMSTMTTGKSDSHSRGSRSSISVSSLNKSDGAQHKARITMFPHFEAKLDNLKAIAQEMMDSEEDPDNQDIVAQQFAEASLTILRHLRYHCMESGLDGWRQGKLRRKILIVDDSIVTRKLVTRAFEKANFIVDTAENGVMGVGKMKESIYDIAFMDIDMPVMNGFDATKAFRIWEDSVRPGARQPICALTAAHVEDFDKCELMKFKDAGLDVMESKPCNISRLFKVVDDVAPMFSDLSINASQYDSKIVT